VAKKKAKLWFGYLEAGERSSPVVRDGEIDTGRSSTIYLFNRSKGKILEYQRDIVEPKLRELDVGESDLIAELEDAYQTARAGFNPRGTSRPKTVRVRRPPPIEPEIPDLEDDDDDEDAWLPIDDETLGPAAADFVD
jgi:hypothetical protein